MQIIETSSLSVRSAFLRLEGGGRAPGFSLFPMLHVGEPAFYERVTRQLEKCDLILYEGVNSRSVSLLTQLYPSLAKGLGLATQQTMKLDHLADRLVHADVTGADFEDRWSKLGPWLRRAVIAGAPVLGMYLRYFATRQSIASHLRLDLKKSREEILHSEDMKLFDDVVVTWRDQHLIGVIEQHRQKHQEKSFSIAVVFGAAHMRAVVRHLTKSLDPGYRVVQSEWMTVFSL